MLVLGSGVLLAQQDRSTELTALMERAGRYVDAYQRDLALIVSEERYEQEVRYPAPPMARTRDISTRTVLRSDFLLVRGPDNGWLPFRDVFERDGTTIRDRDDRLAKLFLAEPGSAMDQARKIFDESTRYNLGSINRNINLPTLALIFLTDTQRGRFEFTDRGRDDNTRVVQYREVARPTYVSTTGGRDLPVSGRYWIDEASGRVERSELIAADAAVDARIDVTYRRDEGAGLWVPVRMEEVYKQRTDRSEITGIATYSRFRRFQVKTTEGLSNK